MAGCLVLLVCVTMHRHPAVAAEPMAPPVPSVPADPDAARAKVTAETLDRALELGTRFLLHSQQTDGLFRYHVDLETGATLPEQSAVRQAGALWGLTLMHARRPSNATRQAVQRGLDFYRAHSVRTRSGARYIRFPGAVEGDSGAVALVVLALVDFLRVEPPASVAALRQQLVEYVDYLWSLRRYDGRFASHYLVTTGQGWGRPSPYFDGEILLALASAAQLQSAGKLNSPLMARPEFSAHLLDAATAMYEAYAADAIDRRADLGVTKGFYQWGCMAFEAIDRLGWDESERPLRRAWNLSIWMIDVHDTLSRRGNTAYAVEGLTATWQLARRHGQDDKQRRLRVVIEQALSKLITWQVGGPQPNAYLRSVTLRDPTLVGGILSSAANSQLRIDTTQHQMHACQMARQSIWNSPPP